MAAADRPWTPILARLDHPDVWGPAGVAPLEGFRRAGRGWLARCPRHRPDLHPSFWMPRGSTYGRCFACGYRVGWIASVAERTGLDFWGALEQLARRAGLPVVRQPRADRPDVWALADRWLRRQLLEPGEPAETCRRYLESRGLPAETLERLPVGCLPSPALAARVLTAAGCRPRDVAATGLTARYLARTPLMFIYYDPSGAPCGFKGRAPERQTKRILNAKGFGGARERRALYCADLARDAIAREGLAVLVEGEFDALPFHTARRAPVVALGGTAKPSPDTFETLRALGAERVLLAFDSDPAGQAATAAALGQAWAAGLEPLVARLPAGAKDPDEACQALGPAAALERLRRDALAPEDWLAARWRTALAVLTPEGRAAVLAEVRRLAASAPPTALERLVERAAGPLGVSPQALAAELDDVAERARLERVAAEARAVGARLQGAKPASVDGLVAESLESLARLYQGGTHVRTRS